MPVFRKCPGTAGGRGPGTSEPDFCATPRRLDRMSAGQTGHFHRTNGTRPRDGCDPTVEVSHRISFCLLVFLLRSADTKNTDTLALLARSPTRKRFPHSAVYECLKAFFRHARVFKTHRHAVYQCLKKPPTFFRHASVSKHVRFDTRVPVFKTRVFAHLSFSPRLRSFKKGLADRGGWRKEIPPTP